MIIIAPWESPATIVFYFTIRPCLLVKSCAEDIPPPIFALLISIDAFAQCNEKPYSPFALFFALSDCHHYISRSAALIGDFHFQYGTHPMSSTPSRSQPRFRPQVSRSQKYGPAAEAQAEKGCFGPCLRPTRRDEALYGTCHMSVCFWGQIMFVFQEF